MNRRLLLPALFPWLLCVLPGCLSADSIDVNTIYGPAAPLTTEFPTTYAWAPAAIQERRAVEARPEAEELFRSMFDESIQAEGYSMTADPGFLVAYSVASEAAMERTGWDPTAYRKGTLVVDFLHPSREEVMWRATLSGKVLTEESPELRRERLAAALEKVMEALPKND